MWGYSSDSTLTDGVTMGGTRTARCAGGRGRNRGARAALLGALFLLCALPAAGGQGDLRATTAPEPLQLTGNLRVDLFADLSVAPPSLQIEEASPPRKSPWLAAGLSFVLPGAGEFYAESYWKSALFLAVEVAAWTVAYTQDRKGDRQTESFEAYANTHWNVVQYAERSQALAPGGGVYNWLIAGTEGRPPWERVNWAELNRMERDIAGTLPGRYYSHTLPLWGEQQYYELIGKYQQFYQGWDDADPSLDDYDEIAARLQAGGTRFTYYAGERGKANDFYSVAGTAVTIAILNHIVSALDAAWSAGSYNGMHASVGALPAGGGMARVPAARLEYRF